MCAGVRPHILPHHPNLPTHQPSAFAEPVLRFMFYLIFFTIIFTYYGMPLHIIRELWVSYQNLRRRLTTYQVCPCLRYKHDTCSVCPEAIPLELNLVLVLPLTFTFTFTLTFTLDLPEAYGQHECTFSGCHGGGARGMGSGSGLDVGLT